MKRLLAIFLLFAVSCTHSQRDYVVVEGAMLGTTFRIIADVPIRSAELYGKVLKLDRELKSEMSIFDNESHLSRLNANLTDSLTDGLIYNLELADSVSRLSGGRYDVTVLPLVRAWGFAGDDASAHPNVDSILQFVGYQKLQIDGHRLVKSDPRMQIDLNSIAKGYCVDRVAEMLRTHGSANYLVDIGGEINCAGVNREGAAWKIGVETPFDGNISNGEYLTKRISMPAESKLRGMATSGNYRRYYLDDAGNKIAHTIDPITGYSAVSRLLSATVIASNCALADAYGTMFMSVGSSRAVELAEEIENIEVYFIFGAEDGGYEEYLSEGMSSLVL